MTSMIMPLIYWSKSDTMGDNTGSRPNQVTAFDVKHK